MRRIPFVVLALIVLLGAGASAAQPAPRIGYIDSQKILSEAPGTTAAQEAFEAELVDIENKRAEVGEESLRLLEQAREADLHGGEDHLQRQFQETQQRLQELERLAAQRQMELMQPVRDEISDVIEAVREDGSYASVFDTGAGVIAAANPTLDLTDEVIRRLWSSTGDLVSASASAAQPALKIGYINSQKILSETPHAIAAQEALEAELADIENKIAELDEKSRRLRVRYEGGDTRVDLERWMEEFPQRVQELERLAPQRQMELMQPVRDEISDVIEAVREDGSYAFVFDMAAGAIAAANPTLDLTNEVIRRLRSSTAD